LKENPIEITVEIREVEGGEVGEPLEEATKDGIREAITRGCDLLFTECERDSDTVGDGEQHFANKGERLQIAVAVVSVEESDDTLPTLPTFLW
jgi:hypothetical protein